MLRSGVSGLLRAVAQGGAVWLGLLLFTTAGATEHDFGGLRIAVDADVSAYVSASDYQITVANEELLLTRLTAPYLGTLSNSFVADLNKDGNFEVVVTFTHTGGTQTGIHLYTWSEFRLQPIKVAALAGGQLTGYQGGDQFAVAGGELVRIYQVHKETENGWEPTAERRRLRYSLADSRWIAE